MALHRLSHTLTAALSKLGVTHQRRVMALMLMMLAVDFADRALIGALGPTLKHVFDINNTQLGLLATATTAVAALATIPVGMLTDRINRTNLLAVSMVIWVGATVLTGAAVSFAMLIGARLLLGADAASAGPTVPSLVGDMVPAGQRGRALGIVNAGQLVGTGIGIVLAATVAELLSFRWCFWLLALAGIAIVIGFARAREPKRTGAAGPGKERAKPGEPHTKVQRVLAQRGVPPSDNAILREDPKAMSMWDATRYVLRVRTDWIVLLARSIGDYFFAGVGTFGVVFATDNYGVSQQRADLAILLLGVGALLGFLGAGKLGDWLLERGHVTSQIWIGVIGYIASPLILLPAVLTHSLAVALPFLMLGALILAATSPSLDAIRIDVIVPLLRGRAEAIRQVVRSAAEAAAPSVFGLIAGHLILKGFSGVQLAFLITLPCLAITGFVLLGALPSYEPDVAAALVSTEAEESGQPLRDVNRSTQNVPGQRHVGQRDDGTN